MIVYEEQPVFRNRADAGQRLAEILHRYQGSEVIVFAIPRGGVPVAVEVAEGLSAPLDVVVPRKITIPYNPEAGYGAVTEDGTIVLNEPLVERLGLTRSQIEYQAEEVRAEIGRRSALYRGKLQAPQVSGKTAIIIDDGLASGFTMLAAIKSMRQRKAARIVVAVPVASGSAHDLIKPVAAQLVCLVVARGYPFAFASFYHHWYDLSDEEVIKYLEDWRTGHRPTGR
jgi:predicted phosphoribosyltransferase